MRLKRFKEHSEIGLLLVSQPNIEPLVIEVDQVSDLRCPTIMEIRRTAGNPANDGYLGFADIGALAGDHGDAEIGDGEGLPREWPVHSTVNTGNPETSRLGGDAPVTPISTVKLDEWLPTPGLL